MAKQLTKEEFLFGLKYLKSFYLNNNIDTSNKEMLNVWYDYCKNLPKEYFLNTIKQYCSQEEFPPKTPNQLLKYCNFKNGESVWEQLVMLNDQYPYDNEYYSSKFWQDFPKDKIAYQIIKEMIGATPYNIFDEEKTDWGEIELGLTVVVGYEYRKKSFIEKYNFSQQEQKILMLNDNFEEKKMLENN